MSIVQINMNSGTESLAFKLDLDPAFSNEKMILGFLQNNKYYEPEVTAAMLRIVRAGDTVLDVGANVGVFSVLLSQLVGATGHVVCFEPGANSLPRLKANLALNNLGNVVLIEQPCGREAGEVTLFLNSDDSGGNALWDPGACPANVLSRTAPRPHRLTSTTVDAEMARLQLPVPRLIKVDTEGADHLVLQGASSLLRGCQVPFVFAELFEFALQKMGSSIQELRAFMEGFGYSTFALYHCDALPKFIPPGTELRLRYISDILFSTPKHVATCWPLEVFDPVVARSV